MTTLAPLANEITSTLVPQAQQGDQHAFETLVMSNQRLVRHIAKKCAYIPFEDAVSEGNIALMLAIKSFDCKRNTLFSQYAYQRIYYHLLDVMEQYRPMHTKRYSRMSEDERSMLNSSSLNEDDENGNEYIDNVFDENAVFETDRALAKEDRLALHNAINATLDCMEQSLINEYYVQKKTLQEIAGNIGLSHESVRQTIQDAVAKIKAYLAK